MNALLKTEIRWWRPGPLLDKEIRLLRPAFFTALLLAVVPVWVTCTGDFTGVEARFLVSVPLWLGALLMALSSFGREFGLSTFPLLLAQPLERRRIWQTKVAVLTGGLLAILVAGAISWQLSRGFHADLSANSWYAENGGLTGLALPVLVIFASGLWTTLLLRRMATAFWVALLVPIAILIVFAGSGGRAMLAEVMLALYACVGIAWARGQFLRAQEVAWTGGEVEGSRWRFSRGVVAAATQAGERITAWFWPGLKMYQVALIILVPWLFHAEYGEHLDYDIISIGLTMLSVGPWTTALAHHTRVAFWIALLLPLILFKLVLTGLAFFDYEGGPLPQHSELILPILLATYLLIGLWRASRQLSLAPALANPLGRNAQRSYRPVTALFWNELKLNQVGLLGMATLFLLHLGVVFARKAAHQPGESNLVRTALEVFGGVWVLVPALTASLSVAEERRMGTWASHRSLPISARIQFFIKLLFVILLCGCVSGTLLWTAEGIGEAIGAGGGLGSMNVSLNGEGLPVILGIFVILAVLAFHASSLSRDVMQAIGITVASAVILLTCWELGANSYEWTGWHFRSGPLLGLIGLPVMLVTLLSLAYLNFRGEAELRRRWLGNLAVLAGSLLAAVGVTAATYHRVWDYLTPLEPAHGPARLSLAEPPKFITDRGNITIILPDGRLWEDRITYQDPDQKLMLGGLPTGFKHTGQWLGGIGQHFKAGSNWIGSAIQQNECVAIRADGSLWVSEKQFQPGKLIRFGEENDWKMVVPKPLGEFVLLLKTNGTLWEWGTNQPARASLRATTPHPLDSKSDWADLFAEGGQCFGLDANGKAWNLDRLIGNAEQLYGARPSGMYSRQPDSFPFLDGPKWCHLGNEGFGVRKDGSLWYVQGIFVPPNLRPNRDGVGQMQIQIGREQNWVSVAAGEQILVALKSDGTLWRWDADTDSHNHWRKHLELVAESPRRLGIHRDWVGLGNSPRGVVSLAADGGLWDWSPIEESDELWEQPKREILREISRKPKLIENIFDQH